MATNITFSSLKTDMSNYLERGGSAITDTTVFEQLPRLVNAAERNLAQELKLLGQIEVLVMAPVGLQIGTAVLTKPDRWRATVSMNFGTGVDQNTRKPLFPRGLEYCQAYWPDQTATDEPRFYAEYDYQHWLIAPTPDQDYPLQVLAWMQPRLLDDGNQSNFWTEYCPNALLYGCLLQMEAFLKEDAREPMWGQMYQEQMQQLQSQDAQRVYDRMAQRTRP